VRALKILFRRVLVGLLIVLVVGAAAIYALYRYGLYAPLPAKAEGYAYTVRSGMSLSQVARELNRDGILTHSAAFAWVLYARVKNRAHLLKAGDYQFPAGLNAHALLAMLLRGDTVNYSITLVEGWNFSQVLAAIAVHSKLTPTLASLDHAAIMAHLGYPDVHPEGRFYPDTYVFGGGMDDAALLKLAYTKMERELALAWESRANDIPLKSPDELLTLASIVEKETGVAHERPIIAGVFSARLRRNMRLQTDPTVIYGIGPDFNGNLTRADLQRDTPYNTYTRAGLPPTPIAMPGRAALRAAAMPEKVDYLYFVAQGDGTHYFSQTLTEHNCAVIRYQLRNSPLKATRCRQTPGCDACP
jgi:UPF0755 protein